MLKDTIMNTLDIFIEKGKKIGIEKGIEIGKLDVVENLLRNTDFSTVKIAELTGVSEVIVNRILNKINCQKWFKPNLSNWNGANFQITNNTKNWNENKRNVPVQ